MNSLAFDFPESEEFGDTESEPGKVDGGASGDGAKRWMVGGRTEGLRWGLD